MLELITLFVYLISLSIHFYLLVRVQTNPIYNFGFTNSWANLISWIRMDIYGQESNFLMIFKRRAPFWEYQIKRMYLQYFGWNFLGKPGLNTFFHNFYLTCIPLILGITGFIYNLIKKFKVWIFNSTVFTDRCEIFQGKSYKSLSKL